MSINVYTIQHPLVLKWVSYLNYNELTVGDQFDIINKIGISLIYEATRKSVKLNNLYLKQLNEIVEVNILPPGVNHLVFADMYLCQILSKDIINLIPLSNIYPISDSLDTPRVTIHQKTYNILIIQQDIDQHKILYIIDKILDDYPKNKINNIQICCIKCTTSSLQFLGHRYPKLNIYTTQIINDNNN